MKYGFVDLKCWRVSSLSREPVGGVGSKSGDNSSSASYADLGVDVVGLEDSQNGLHAPDYKSIPKEDLNATIVRFLDY